MCDEYNGWTNRETWAVALYTDSEQFVQEAVNAMAVATYEEHGEDKASALVELEQDIEALWDEAFSDIENMDYSSLNMLKDIGSLYRVNWREIAESYLYEAIKEAEDNA